MDFRKYIGIPYERHGRSTRGTDCYGLIVMIYKDHLKIDLPDPDYHDWKQAPDYLTAFFQENPKVVSWYHKLWVPINEPEKYDIVLLQLFPDVDAPSHSGLYIGDGKFIHSMDNLPVTIHRFERWKKHVHSMYRYKERVVNG